MRKPRWYITVSLVLLAGVVLWSIPAIISHLASARTQQHGSNMTTTPIQHVVIMMLENHTFDNHFGRFPGADGVPLQHACDPVPTDYNHNAAANMAALDGGKMDQFPKRASVQYRQSDIPIYWSYAQQYALGDYFFLPWKPVAVPTIW